MAHFSRIALLLPALIAIAPACSGGDGKDDEPPKFAGLTGAVAVSAGTAELSWEKAKDPSDPVTYRVWMSASPGGEAFALAPVAETEELSIVITGLPAGAAPTYFVVRARDSRGNEEDNTVEHGVQFTPNRLSLVSDYELPVASDVAVSPVADIIALGGFTTDPLVHAWIFDVSDPADPQLASTILHPDGGRSTDVEIRGNVLWVSTEYDPDDVGAYSYDITDPANPVPLGMVTGTNLGMCHTITLHEDILYCASSEDGEIHLVDVSDPSDPQPRGSIAHSFSYIHDMYIDDNLAVGCFLWGGFAFLDVSDPMNPSITQEVQYADAFTHNAWPSDDGNFLFTTDETTDGHLRVWDISNRASVSQVGEYWADPGQGPHAIVHNVQVLGDLAYVGWYEAGVHVLDVSNPATPILIGAYDTFPGPTQGVFGGAWSAAPAPGKPYVYVSDYSAGLFVLELAPP